MLSGPIPPLESLFSTPKEVLQFIEYKLPILERHLEFVNKCSSELDARIKKYNSEFVPQMIEGFVSDCKKHGRPIPSEDVLADIASDLSWESVSALMPDMVSECNQNQIFNLIVKQYICTLKIVKLELLGGKPLSDVLPLLQAAIEKFVSVPPVMTPLPSDIEYKQDAVASITTELKEITPAELLVRTATQTPNESPVEITFTPPSEPLVGANVVSSTEPLVSTTTIDSSAPLPVGYSNSITSNTLNRYNFYRIDSTPREEISIQEAEKSYIENNHKCCCVLL